MAPAAIGPALSVLTGGLERARAAQGEAAERIAASPFDVDAIVDLVEPGGIVVLDDFTPCESWPPIFMGRVDTLPESWLTDERFTAGEGMIAPDASASIAALRSLAGTCMSNDNGTSDGCIRWSASARSSSLATASKVPSTPPSPTGLTVSFLGS